jgi:hypothetical protein
LFEGAEDNCSQCGREYCHECLVYPFGAKKPPLCHACAIARAGIRKHAARSKVASKRELKRLEKERKRKAKLEREVEPAVEVTTMDIGPALREDLDEEATAALPPPPPASAGAIDWSAPFQSGSLSTH